MQAPQRHSLACFLTFIYSLRDTPEPLKQIATALLDVAWTNIVYTQARKDVTAAMKMVEANPTSQQVCYQTAQAPVPLFLCAKQSRLSCRICMSRFTSHKCPDRRTKVFPPCAGSTKGRFC